MCIKSEPADLMPNMFENGKMEGCVSTLARWRDVSTLPVSKVHCNLPFANMVLHMQSQCKDRTVVLLFT